MFSFVTPLRYPGGKGRLGAWIAQLIVGNDLQEGCYIEPYAGGAGAAMYLLANNYIERIVINDIDPVIYSFWWALKNDSKKLIDLILTTPVSLEEWHRQREIVLKEDTKKLTQLGFAAFFQNRTNRSGIIKGGVIGGQDQSGIYRIDARYNKESLAKRVEILSALSERIEIYNLDAIDFLKAISLEKNAENLIYLDPPYYNKGSQLYRNFYNENDHQEVATEVKKLSIPWIVTYDNCDEINSLYKWANSHEFSMKYSTHLKRPVGKEVCFYGNLKLHTPPFLKR